jgi:hypothetical protein
MQEAPEGYFCGHDGIHSSLMMLSVDCDCQSSSGIASYIISHFANLAELLSLIVNTIRVHSYETSPKSLSSFLPLFGKKRSHHFFRTPIFNFMLT